ncbi:hypothetical protein HYV73_04090 [Candidatus Uhrbacteria bacterium]|nr:hypothetical protein [Candidatus Uhrbacteria bacterium]
MPSTKDTFSLIKEAYQGRGVSVRAVSVSASEALHASKRAIFALHRNDRTQAETLLADAATHFSTAEALMKKEPSLSGVGAYRAGLEEYAEALLFFEYQREGKIVGDVDARVLEPDIFIGGLSDATGEIVRDAVRRATQGDHVAVRRAKDAVETAVAYLMELDLTGNLRQKFDQAKRNLQTLEHMLYETSLRITHQMDLSAE